MRVSEFEQTTDMIKAKRVTTVRKYFNDRKEAERIKMQRREMILSDINSGKYDYILFKR